LLSVLQMNPDSLAEAAPALERQTGARLPYGNISGTI
jgi:hypothetical protein